MKNTPMAKEEYIGFRTSTETKQLLQKLADDGYRTLSQQCEMIIVKWLKEQGYLKEEKPPKASK
jgi:ribosomal protein S8